MDVEPSGEDKSKTKSPASIDAHSQSSAADVEIDANPATLRVQTEGKLLVGVVDDHSSSALPNTICSLERAIEVALSRGAISAAELTVTVGAGSKYAEIVGALRDGTYQYITTFTVTPMATGESSAAAFNRLLDDTDAEFILLVQGGAVIAANGILQLVATLRASGAAMVEARRIPFPVQRPITSGYRLPYATSSCLLMSTRSFRKLGGFDTLFFSERLFSVDFSWRAFAAGSICLLEPTAIYHLENHAHALEPDAKLFEEAVLLAHKWRADHIRDQILTYCVQNPAKAIAETKSRFEYRQQNNYLPEAVPDGYQYVSFSGEIFSGIAALP